MINRLYTVWVMGFLLLGCASIPDSRVSELENRLAKVEGTLEAITSVSTAQTAQLAEPTDPSEQVVLGYIEAIKNGDCEAALSYFAPDKRNEAVRTCLKSRLTANRIDSIVVRADWSKNVTLIGSFEIKWTTGTEQFDSVTFRLEEANGQWFLIRHSCNPIIICE